MLYDPPSTRMQQQTSYHRRSGLPRLILPWRSSIPNLNHRTTLCTYTLNFTYHQAPPSLSLIILDKPTAPAPHPELTVQDLAKAQGMAVVKGSEGGAFGAALGRPRVGVGLEISRDFLASTFENLSKHHRYVPRCHALGLARLIPIP